MVQNRHTLLKNANSNRTYSLSLLCVLWLGMFALYFPAARAGFVTDYTGWLEQIRSQGFWDFINRTHFKAKSLYQLTQFNTYILYKLLGTSEWAWHIVFISLHTLNAWLLFHFFYRLVNDAGVKKSRMTATAGAILFCVSPYISEVIVWEPAFHFLQGLLLILLILLCTQQFISTHNNRYAIFSVILFSVSLFSLEVFYITPWLVLSLGIFYAALPATKVNSLKKVAINCFLPMLLLFAIRFIAYKAYAGDWVSRIGSGSVNTITIESFGKPANYIFHLLFIGRFLPEDLRHEVYGFFNSEAGVVALWGMITIIFMIVTGYHKKMGAMAKAATLLFVWLLLALLLLVPLWFQPDLLVWFDRYLYFAAAFFYMLFALLASFISTRYITIAVVTLFGLINLRYAIQVSRYWGKSYRVVHSLLNNIPDDRNKTMILLNVPANMHGVPMIGAEKNSEYKLMHDLLIPQKVLTNSVYDVLAYNMQTPDDGAHVNIINDSMIKVTLNQWGTWWWFETKGGYSYWNTDYKLDLKDPGHWYELTLRKPAEEYILLYSVGGEWKRVDMSKRIGDQN